MELEEAPKGNKKNGYFLRSSFISSFAVAIFVFRAITGIEIGGAEEVFEPLPVGENAVLVSASVLGVGSEVLGISTESDYGLAGNVEQEYFLDRSPRDQRGVKLEGYLKKRGSPMAPHADLIISESDKYGVDYKLVVAIAYHESGLGRKCWAPYNAWGWMTKDRWGSWEESIPKYIRGLYNGYYAKGANTIDAIAPKYVMTDKWPVFVVDIKKLMAEIP